MAIPVEHEMIGTNLPQTQLEKVLKAIEEKCAPEVPGSGWLYIGAGYWEVDFEGARYGIAEDYEIVSSVILISATPSHLQVLITELDNELSVAVSAKDFGRAKEINARIEALQGLQR